jgi:hypothetical protein
MTRYIVLDTEGKICASSTDTQLKGGSVEELPEEFDPERQQSWSKANGVWTMEAAATGA